MFIYMLINLKGIHTWMLLLSKQPWQLKGTDCLWHERSWWRIMVQGDWFSGTSVDPSTLQSSLSIIACCWRLHTLFGQRRVAGCVPSHKARPLTRRIAQDPSEILSSHHYALLKQNQEAFHATQKIQAFFCLCGNRVPGMRSTLWQPGPRMFPHPWA